MLCQVYLAVCECEQITLHQPVCIENGRCFKPVPLHSTHIWFQGATVDLQVTVKQANSLTSTLEDRGQVFSFRLQTSVDIPSLRSPLSSQS